MSLSKMHLPSVAVGSFTTFIFMMGIIDGQRRELDEARNKLEICTSKNTDSSKFVFLSKAYSFNKVSSASACSKDSIIKKAANTAAFKNSR